jgi:hypothetical protein
LFNISRFIGVTVLLYLSRLTSRQVYQHVALPPPSKRARVIAGFSVPVAVMLAGCLAPSLPGIAYLLLVLAALFAFGFADNIILSGGRLIKNSGSAVDVVARGVWDGVRVAIPRLLMVYSATHLTLAYLQLTGWGLGLNTPTASLLGIPHVPISKSNPGNTRQKPGVGIPQQYMVLASLGNLSRCF